MISLAAVRISGLYILFQKLKIKNSVLRYAGMEKRDAFIQYAEKSYK
jgi:hypothetical protein